MSYLNFIIKHVINKGTRRGKIFQALVELITKKKEPAATNSFNSFIAMYVDMTTQSIINIGMEEQSYRGNWYQNIVIEQLWTFLPT